LRVVMLVQSFGLPTALPLPDRVLQSNSIRLIQVHKPFKHQVLYDAIRTLADQLVLSGVGGGAGGGGNSALGSSSSSGSTGYAMTLLQNKSRRALVPIGATGSSVGGLISGDSTTQWTSRRTVIRQPGGPRSSSDLPLTPSEASRQDSNRVALPPPITVQHPFMQVQSSPLMPPSPFVHSQLTVAQSAMVRSPSAPVESSTSLSSSSLLPPQALPLPSQVSPASILTMTNKAAWAAASAAAAGGVAAMPVSVDPKRAFVPQSHVLAAALSASMAAPPIAPAAVPGTSRNAPPNIPSSAGARSPHITTGSSRMRSAPTLNAAFAERWPLRILICEDVSPHTSLMRLLLICMRLWEEC
jgi:hypothetical protein